MCTSFSVIQGSMYLILCGHSTTTMFTKRGKINFLKVRQFLRLKDHPGNGVKIKHHISFTLKFTKKDLVLNI